LYLHASHTMCKGSETLLAHGIDAQAIGLQFIVKLSIIEGEAVGNAAARDGADVARHDDMETIVSVLLLNEARQQQSGASAPSREIARVNSGGSALQSTYRNWVINVRKRSRERRESEKTNILSF